MDHYERLRHWANHERPFHFKGRNQRRPRQLPILGPNDVVTDGAGNVLRIPEIHGLPCFAIPTVWLRYIGLTLGHNEHTGHAQESRCNRCPVEGACRKIVLERLGVDPEVKALAYRWLDRHREKREFRNSEGTRLIRKLADLGPFQNSNDAVVAREQARAQEAARIREAKRKRDDRRRLLANKTVHPDYQWAAKQERKRRFEVAARYFEKGLAPRRLGLITPQSTLRTANVWLARQILRWQKLPHGPSQIARWLRDNDMDGGSTYDVLRQAVPVHLERVKRYETEILDGCAAPLWAKFDPEATLAGRSP